MTLLSDYSVGVPFLPSSVSLGMCSFQDSRSYFIFLHSVLNSSASLSSPSKKWTARALTSASPWLWNAGLCLFGISMGSNAENALSTGRADLNLLLMFFTRALMCLWRSPCRSQTLLSVHTSSRVSRLSPLERSCLSCLMGSSVILTSFSLSLL